MSSDNPEIRYEVEEFDLAAGRYYCNGCGNAVDGGKSFSFVRWKKFGDQWLREVQFLSFTLCWFCHNRLKEKI